MFAKIFKLACQCFFVKKKVLVIIACCVILAGILSYGYLYSICSAPEIGGPALIPLVLIPKFIIMSLIEHPIMPVCQPRLLVEVLVTNLWSDKPHVPPKYLPALISILEGTNQDSSLRAEIAYSLGYSKKDEVGPVLLKLLDDADKDVRAGAISSLSDLGDPAYGEAIARKLDDSEPIVRFRAANAIDVLGVSELVRLSPQSRVLKECARKECYDCRLDCAIILSKLKTRGQTQLLLELAQTADYSISGNAMCALGRTKDPAALPFLRSTVSYSPDIISVDDAAVALAEMNDKASLPEIEKRMQESVDAGMNLPIIKNWLLTGVKPPVCGATVGPPCLVSSC